MGIKQGASAKFSTVLVRIKKTDPTLGPMDGERFKLSVFVLVDTIIYLISKGLE